MNISWPKAFKVGGFLAGLCAVLALAIAGADLLTKDIILRNKLEKESQGLRKIFGSSADYGEAKEVNEGYIQKYWTVTESDASLGRVYSVKGKNAYGDVALLVGIDTSFRLGEMVTIENTESYGQTLEDNYLAPYAEASDKEEALSRVSCGATYGAKLCRDMVLAALEHYKEGK